MKTGSLCKRQSAEKLHLPLLSYRQNNKMLQNETKHHKMTNISEMAGKHEANKPRCYRIQLDAI